MNLEPYRQKLERAALSILKNPQAAEDCASWAIVRAMEREGQFRGESSMETWLTTIARRRAFEILRHPRTVSLDALHDDGFDATAPAMKHDGESAAAIIHRAIGKIPKKQGRALIDHFLNGLSVREMARSYRVPVGTVLSRIHGGKAAMRGLCAGAL